MFNSIIHILDILQGAAGTNITIDTVCGLMMNDSNGSPLTRYASVNTLILQAYGQKCVDYSYQDFVDSLRNESWAGSAAEGGEYVTFLPFCLFSLNIFQAASGRTKRASSLASFSRPT